MELLSIPSDEWLASRDRAGAGPHLGDPWISYRRARGSRPLYLLARAGDGTPAAVGVAYLARPRFRPWRSAAVTLDRTLWAVPPHAENPDGWAPALLRLAARERWASLEVQSFDGPSPPPELARLGFACTERHEFLLDLRREEEALFAALKSSHRRKVRKAAEAGVEVAEERTAAAVERVRVLQGDTRERRSRRGEKMALAEARQYRTLADTAVAGGGATVYTGRLGGEVVSAILVGLSRTRAYYLLGGTGPAGLEVNAASLVMWEAIRRARAAGVAWFNLGGVPRHAEDPEAVEHGLYRFKDGWGAARCPCRSGVWRR